MVYSLLQYIPFYGNYGIFLIMVYSVLWGNAGFMSLCEPVTHYLGTWSITAGLPFQSAGWRTGPEGVVYGSNSVYR